MPRAPSDAEIAEAVLAMARARAPSSLCPSEVARGLAEDWRPLMTRVRDVAASLPQIVATQGGIPCDARTAGGPIRLSLR